MPPKATRNPPPTYTWGVVRSRPFKSWGAVFLLSGLVAVFMQIFNNFGEDSGVPCCHLHGRNSQDLGPAEHRSGLHPGHTHADHGLDHNHGATCSHAHGHDSHAHAHAHPHDHNHGVHDHVDSYSGSIHESDPEQIPDPRAQTVTTGVYALNSFLLSFSPRVTCGECDMLTKVVDRIASATEQDFKYPDYPYWEDYGDGTSVSTPAPSYAVGSGPASTTPDASSSNTRRTRAEIDREIFGPASGKRIKDFDSYDDFVDAVLSAFGAQFIDGFIKSDDVAIIRHVFEAASEDPTSHFNVE